jgi:hypothetical protein
VALDNAERMDKLWESFNEDLALRHRDRARRSKSAAGINIKVSRAAAGLDDPSDSHWHLCNYSLWVGCRGGCGSRHRRRRGGSAAVVVSWRIGERDATTEHTNLTHSNPSQPDLLANPAHPNPFDL